MKQIDLHVHSDKSDGTMTPSQLVRHAAACGLSAFALTDHDSTDGIEEALFAAIPYGIEVIPGIEFSTAYLGQDIHIVALEPDWKHPEFRDKLKFYRGERLRRNQKMIDKMAADGIDISYEKMVQSFSETVWTRAHFARYLADHGYVSDMWDAFRTHIGENCPYFVPREKVSPMEITAIIRHFGGIPILAHPYQYRLSPAELDELLHRLCENGLIGMEAYYSTYTAEQTHHLLGVADRFGLLPSGGSDFHGTNKPDIALGTGKNNLSIPYEVLTELRRKKTAPDYLTKEDTK